MKLRILFTLLAFCCLCTSMSAKVFLVAVGVADYPGSENDLLLPVKDAKAIVSLYARNVAATYMLLTDKQATKERVKDAMRKTFASAAPDDIVVFYFSGHGYPNGFCAYDGHLTYGEVRKAMAGSRCHNKMIFADACYAGGLRSNSGSGHQQAVSAAKKANVMLFLAARSNEVSVERTNMENGMFTAFLLKGLRGGADKDENRTITARELFNYVHTCVVRATGDKQHPVMWGNFNNNMPVMSW